MLLSSLHTCKYYFHEKNGSQLKALIFLPITKEVVANIILAHSTQMVLTISDSLIPQSSPVPQATQPFLPQVVSGSSHPPPSRSVAPQAQ